MISSMVNFIDAHGRRPWASMRAKIIENQLIFIEFQRFHSSTGGGGLADARGRLASVSVHEV